MSRNDDDDRDYDRPRRDKDSGTKTVLIVLGVLGVLAVLGVIGCIGCAGWGIFQAGKAVQEGMQSIVGMTTAEAFMNDLQGGRSAAAYQNTTASFKESMSAKQFDEFLAKNPILTKHKFRTMGNMNPVGQPPVKKVIVSFELHTSDPDGDDPDMIEDDTDVKPKVKTQQTAKDNKAEKLKDGKCTLTMVEENGIWKVDALTIP